MPSSSAKFGSMQYTVAAFVYVRNVGEPGEPAPGYVAKIMKNLEMHWTAEATERELGTKRCAEAHKLLCSGGKDRRRVPSVSSAVTSAQSLLSGAGYSSDDLVGC